MYRKLLVAMVMTMLARAQSAAPLKFDVASVKPSVPSANGRPSFPRFDPGGSFSTSGVPLRFVISAAWNVGFQSVRLTGGPDWVKSVDSAYDIAAKAPAGAFPAGLPSNVRAERLRQMLQALLEDRFKLKIRTESRELPFYAVVVAKNGLKLDKADIDEAHCPQTADGSTSCHALGGGRGRGLHGKAVTIADMLGFVENWTDRPLVDQTDVDGLFQVETRGWRDVQPAQEPPPGAKAEDGQDAADVPTLFELFDRLGLKLQSQKGAVPIFVIEHVERPSAN